MPAKEYCKARTARPGFRLKAISLAVMSAACFSSASAAGLGKITVLSGLGQPLNAEIELSTSSREEANSLAVKLASSEAFRQANVEINPALYSLRFAVEQRNGKSVVRITSAQPLNEPFVDLLLEVSGNNSKLVREYTFLLDPPELRKPQTALADSKPAASAPASASANPAAAPVEHPARAQRSARAERAAAARSERAEAASPARQAASAAGDAIDRPGETAREIETKRGDTLGRLAAEVKQDGVSLDQMLVALYRANPDAFVGNNMNRLRAGQILKVPEAQTATAISKSEARGVIVAQAADFNAYRGKLAGQVAHAAPSSGNEPGQSAGGKITSRVQEQANPVSAAKDKLTVSRSGMTQGGSANTEDKLAREKAAADAAARVKDLEKNVSDLQKLLELKNQGLAEKQASATAVAKPADKTAQAAPQASAPAQAAPAASATAAAPATAPAASADATAAAISAASSAAAGAPAASQSAAAAPVVAAAVPAKPAIKPKIVVPPPPPPPSLVDELLDNPMVMGAGALLLAGLAGLGIRIGRKRREKKAFSDSALLSDTQLATNSLFGTSGGQSVDTSSVFNSSFTPSASQLDTNEVDPVAEADVYIAYGRDAQAEEILKEALRTQPERHAVRLKLLEIYASRKDLRAFDTVASELYSMTKGECPEWPQAAELGAAVDPGNPLYANAKPKAPLASGSGEELDLDALLNTTTSGEHAASSDDASLDFDDEPAGESPAQGALPVDEPEPVELTDVAELDDVAELTQPAEPAVVSKAAASVSAAADDNLMEFSSSAPAPAAAEASAPPVQTEEGDGNTLDFDFDLSQLGAREMIPEPVMPRPTESAAPVLDETPAAFDAPAVSAPNPAFDLNFDLIKPPAPADAATPDLTQELDQLEEFELSLPALDGDAGQADPLLASTNAQPVQPMAFDMGAINLDLGTPASGDGLPELASSITGTAEMTTKLDLALAYQEIGDVEGARELLDEVLKGGSPEQVEKAQSMLEKLA